MTVNQAYRFLGLKPGASRIKIEQAHAAALRRLQLQLVPGTPLADRRRAQDQIVRLTSAFELVKNAPIPRRQPHRSGRRPPPQAQPRGRHAASSSVNDSVDWIGLFRVPKQIGAAGVLLVVFLALLFAVFLLRSTDPDTSPGMAQLRVLSVPWSYVEVNGTCLGTSGQIDAFTLQAGKSRLVLRQGDRALTTTISLPENYETIISAQLENGVVYVTHKKIQLSRD